MVLHHFVVLQNRLLHCQSVCLCTVWVCVCNCMCVLACGLTVTCLSELCYFIHQSICATHTLAHLKMTDKIFPVALDWVFKKKKRSQSEFVEFMNGVFPCSCCPADSPTPPLLPLTLQGCSSESSTQLTCVHCVLPKEYSREQQQSVLYDLCKERYACSCFSSSPSLLLKLRGLEAVTQHCPCRYLLSLDWVNKDFHRLA